MGLLFQGHNRRSTWKDGAELTVLTLIQDGDEWKVQGKDCRCTMLYGKIYCNKGGKNAYLPPAQHPQISRNRRLQMGVCERKALFSLCQSFGQVPGCQESVMQSLASSLAFFHSSRVQDKAQINIGILYKNLVQLIKAPSIVTTGLTSALYYLTRHLHNISFNTVAHCKIPIKKKKSFHVHRHNSSFVCA